MEYDFIAGKNARTLVLLHGTGGTKEDLVPLARYIDKEANILALQGDVEEEGMKRFFRRIKPGVFDEADVKTRSANLLEFLDETIQKHDLGDTKLIGLGYSNGANLLTALLYEKKHPFSALFLHHPMVPYKNGAPSEQDGLPIFIGAGKNDPICTSEQSMTLAKLLNHNGCDVDIHWHDNGHQLSQGELDAAKAFYHKISFTGATT